LLRVANFRRAIITTDSLHDVESRINFTEGAPGKIGVEDLEIASPAGCTMLEESKVEVTAGERVLIVGEPGAGKTLLFRALAGLWPWGAGCITRPKGEEIWYMSRTPYLPPGSLSELLAYPLKVASFRERGFTDALQLLGLRRLVPMLAQTRRWDRELSDDEQQGLAFARVVLHAPPWVLIDEVLDSIDEEFRERVINIFATELKRTGIIHIGRGRARDPMFTRVLHLIKDPTIRRLARHAVPSQRGKPAQRSAADG
jgi:putative ATP-binding cassette transporter